MSLYLCVDCGGSKTSAAIVDASGNIVGRALGGPSNYAYLGLQPFIDAVQIAVSNALKTCVSPTSIDPVSLPPTEPLFAAAWLGISGVDSQSAIDSITPHISGLLGVPAGPNLILYNDASLLAAPLRMYDDVTCAVTVVAGTGSIVVSFTEGEGGAMKEMGRTGGWGWILGDEGGGFHVGREAVRQILTQSDVASVEGPPPPPVLPEGAKPLVARVLEHFGVTDVYELLTVIHLPDPIPSSSAMSLNNPKIPEYATFPREKRLSSLAPLVFASAFEDGDPLALNILRTTSGMLVDQICLLLRPGTPRGVKASEGVVCFGGSLVGVVKYRQMVLDALEKRGHVFKRSVMVDDAAAVGAKGLALVAKPKVT